MCRNIKTLFNFEPPATDEEIHGALAPDEADWVRFEVPAVGRVGFILDHRFGGDCEGAARLALTHPDGRELGELGPSGDGDCAFLVADLPRGDFLIRARMTNGAWLTSYRLRYLFIPQ